jgi:enoyl-CoA hydratase/carnithine racemase
MIGSGGYSSGSLLYNSEKEEREMAENTEHVELEMVEEGIAVLTLNRPDRGNAHTERMRHGLYRLFRACDEDDAVRVIVVTGAGRTFCVGADLASGGDTFNAEARGEAPMSNPERAFGHRIKKPIIAAINGHAVGVGMTMPLTWDLIVVAENAKLAFPFARRGITPEWGSTWLLPRLVGLGRSLDLMLTGRIFSGAEAAAYGLAQEALPADQVLPRALEIAREIRDHCAPVSVALTKKLIWDQLKSMQFNEAVSREDRSLEWVGKQPDVKEGVTSFLEKRNPKWTMRPSVDWPDFLEDDET